MRTTTFQLHPPAMPARSPTPSSSADPVVEPPPLAGTSDNGKTPHLYAVALAFVLVAGAWWCAVNLVADPTYDPSAPVGAPVEGLTIFAVFFVAAFAIERLLEPLTLWYGQNEKADLAAKVASAKTAVEAAYTAQAAVLAAGAAAGQDTQAAFERAKRAAQTSLDEAAGAKAEADRTSGNRAVVLWAAASAVGILGASMLKLYLLTHVGIASPPRPMEILATGLIIGAGTKPLHDLITLIETRKEASAGATPA